MRGGRNWIAQCDLDDNQTHATYLLVFMLRPHHSHCHRHHIQIQNLFASFFSWFERGIFTMWHFRWLVQFPSLHLLYRGPRKDHFWISQQIDKRTWAIHFGQFCALRASLGNFGKYCDYNGCHHGWKGDPFDAGAALIFLPKTKLLWQRWRVG